MWVIKQTKVPGEWWGKQLSTKHWDQLKEGLDLFQINYRLKYMTCIKTLLSFISAL